VDREISGRVTSRNVCQPEAPSTPEVAEQSKRPASFVAVFCANF